MDEPNIVHIPTLERVIALLVEDNVGPLPDTVVPGAYTVTPSLIREHAGDARTRLRTWLGRVPVDLVMAAEKELASLTEPQLVDLCIGAEHEQPTVSQATSRIVTQLFLEI